MLRSECSRSTSWAAGGWIHAAQEQKLSLVGAPGVPGSLPTPTLFLGLPPMHLGCAGAPLSCGGSGLMCHPLHTTPGWTLCSHPRLGSGKSGLHSKPLQSAAPGSFKTGPPQVPLGSACLREGGAERKLRPGPGLGPAEDHGQDREQGALQISCM